MERIERRLTNAKKELTCIPTLYFAKLSAWMVTWDMPNDDFNIATNQYSIKGAIVVIDHHIAIRMPYSILGHGTYHLNKATPNF